MRAGSHDRGRYSAEPRYLLVAGSADGDAAEAVAADLTRCAERKIEYPTARERPTILHGAIDPLASVQVGHHEDRSERFGTMRAGDFMGLEALAARVPLVFPVDGGLFVVRGRARDAAHPHLLKRVGLDRRRAQEERERREPQCTLAIRSHYTQRNWTQRYPMQRNSIRRNATTAEVMVNGLVRSLAAA